MSACVNMTRALVPGHKRGERAKRRFTPRGAYRRHLGRWARTVQFLRCPGGSRHENLHSSAQPSEAHCYLSECSEPFERPDAFSRRYLNGLAGSSGRISLEVSSDDTTWNAVRWPELVTDEKATVARKSLRYFSDWFDTVAVQTSTDVQRILADTPTMTLGTTRDTIRYLMAPGRLFAQFVERIVRMYFALFAYALHHRSVRTSHFSRTRQAGGVDLAQAVYLPFVDRFVTNDAAQYRALRLLRCVAGTKRGEVQRYSTFRSRLLALP